MSPFTPAWLADDPTALGLLPSGYRDSAARRAAVERAGARRVHPAALGALSARTAAQQASIDALARPGGVAVVTGQQAGLFGGPLYTIYKAASAIVCARALQAETGAPCAPVFWLQSEDHDHDEIAACDTLGADGRLHRLTVGARPGEEGRSIAARTLGPEVTDALDALADLLGPLSEAGPTLALLRRCYVPGASPAQAFRELIEALFAEHGLVVLDPAPLTEAARPIHERAVEAAGEIARALAERSAALAAAGFAVQVHVRPGSPLSFFHPDGSAGPRHRLEPDPEGGGWVYRVGGERRRADLSAGARGTRGTFSTFSTSALLRPILQDAWLPTAAYVGGPGEIAYFAQLPPVYAAFDLPVPLVIPRARLCVIDETSARLLGQLGLTSADLGAGRERLLARLVRPGDEREALALEAALEPLAAALAAFGPRAAALDPGLGRAVDKTLESVTGSVGRLAERTRRTLVARDDGTTDRLDRLLARLVPDGTPQERVHAWPWYGARFGVDGFVDRVLAAVRPFDGTLAELYP